MRPFAPHRLRLAVALAVTFAVAPLATAPAFAQDVPADTVALPEIVVTATRLPVPRHAVPAAITVIGTDEIRARGIRTVEEALRGVASSSVVRSGSYGSVTSLFLRGGQSDHVRVLVDGVPVNRPGGSFDFALLSADNVDRIEVLRGPASVLYGSDAMTGVINVLTRRGDGAPRANAAVTGGSHGTVGWDAGLAGGGPAARYSFALARHATDGVYEVHNEHVSTVLSGRVEVRPDPRTEAALTVRYADTEYQYPTDGTGSIVRKGLQLQDVATLGLDVGHRLSDRIEARLLLSATDIGGGFDDRPLDPDDPAQDYRFRSHETLARRGADLRLNAHLGPAAVVTVGASTERQKERSFSETESSFGGSTGSMDVDRSNRAYYAQAFSELGGGVSLNAGVRLDDNEAFGRFGTWRAGVAYRIGEATRLRAAAGTGFKEPTFLENYATGFVRGNPDLQPERSRSWELGIERTAADGRVRIGATYYDQRFERLIQFTAQPIEPDGPNFFNIAEASAAGIEVETTVRLADGLNLRGSYTRLWTRVIDSGFQSGPDAEFAEGEPLLRRPANTGALGIGYRRPGTGGLDLQLVYTGERDDLDFADWPARRMTLPAYVRADLAGEIRVLAPRDDRPAVSAVGRIENLLDESFEEVLNFRAPGRSIFVGIRVGN